MQPRRPASIALLVALATCCAARAAEDAAVVAVSFLKATDFDAPAPAPTSGDDNIVSRLVHRLVPDGDAGPPPPADISMPGPDTSSFPNSPFTLPKGRSSIESLPGTFSLAGADGTPATWSWPFLLRTGLTDSCELRIVSQGPTVVGATPTDPGFDGFAPLAFDLKMHLWGEQDWLYWPAVGVEMFVLTGLGSRPFLVGTEPAIELNVEHRLPDDWLVEWNVGCYGFGGDGVPIELSYPNFGLQWAVQKQVTPRFAAFVQGFYNAAGIPFFPSDLVVGLGGQWNLTQRLAAWTSYNWSVDDTGSPSGGISGFAYAF